MHEQIQSSSLITREFQIQQLAKSWWELQNRWVFDLKSLKLLQEMKQTQKRERVKDYAK